MTPLQLFVNNLSDSARFQIIVDWKSFSSQGMISDSILRSTAEELNTALYGNQAQITFVMRDLYAAICEFYAYNYFSLSFN